jgi:hypothetical protein
VPTVRRILEIYLEHRTSEAETFGEYARRAGAARYAEMLGVPLVETEPINVRDSKLLPVFNQVLHETSPW